MAFVLLKRGADGEDDDEGISPDDAIDFTHRDTAAPRGGYYNECNDNLLLTRTGTTDTQYYDANAQHETGGLRTSDVGAASEYCEADEGGRGSGRDKKERGSGGSINLPRGSKEVGMVANHAPNTLEGVPTSRTRRWWLFMVWTLTDIIPSFLLQVVGRMKRPDIRLAWQEKVTIFMLVLLLNSTIHHRICRIQPSAFPEPRLSLG
jgi:chitin synthase